MAEELRRGAKLFEQDCAAAIERIAIERIRFLLGGEWHEVMLQPGASQA